MYQILVVDSLTFKHSDYEEIDEGNNGLYDGKTEYYLGVGPFSAFPKVIM